MRNSLINKINSQDWNVMRFDWRDGADTFLVIQASEMLANANEAGKKVANRILEGNYAEVHLIAFSAGSNVIQSAVSKVLEYNESQGKLLPKIHMTFLDAYAPTGFSDIGDITNYIDTYGKIPEYAEQYVYREQYVDTRFPPDTNAMLTNATNYDVTNVSGRSDNEHEWPIEWYQSSITIASQFTQGFPLSLESGASFLPMTKKGGYCWDVQFQMECDARNRRIQSESKHPQMISTFVSGTGTVTSIEDLQKYTLETASPVWLKFIYNTKDQINSLRFDHRFISDAGAEGVLTVFADDQIIYKADERFDREFAIGSSDDIWIGNWQPGEHKLVFRLDPFTKIHSKVEISNIQFEFLENKEIIDNIAPTTSVAHSPQPNSNGWNKNDVTVTLTATDNTDGSGVKEIVYSATGSQTIEETTIPGASASVKISSEGQTTLTYFARDNTGNTETAKTITIKLDKTPPVITSKRSPSVNSSGWNNTDVTVNFNCSDDLSGVDTQPLSPQVIKDEGANQSVNATCSDNAGNNATFTEKNINIDKTPPPVTCSVSPSSIWPPDHKMMPVTANVTITDALSGPDGFTLDSITSSEPDSGLGDGDESNDIQGFNPGTASTNGQVRAERSGTGNGRVYTLNYKGMDKAGNSAACTTTVTVPHDQNK